MDGSGGSASPTAAGAMPEGGFPAAASPSGSGDGQGSRPVTADELARAKAVAELSQKVVQLTKVIVFLHTRGDGHEARCAELRSACEDEVRQVAKDAAGRVEAQRQHTSDASVWREQRLEFYKRQQAEREEEAVKAIRELRAASEAREEAARRRFTEGDTARNTTIVQLRRQAERLRTELGAAESRARSDRQWLARQLAGEAARERRRLDEGFEEESARLRAGHAQEAEELKSAREASVAALRAQHAEGRAAAQEEAEAELATALERQERVLEAERRGLEERTEGAREELAAARGTAGVAKEECAGRQRLLDEMSRELQERKRQAHALSSEMDQAHHRKVKAEAEARELRRQKAAIERALVGLGAAPQTERAVAGLSEDVRSAQARLEALRSELARTRRLLDERRAALVDRERQAGVLARELAEEHRRADELQRALLRLESSA